ncbi:hypothetical protein PFISCL1PPCAC_21094, partial [Pristionchus fissidentatus]
NRSIIQQAHDLRSPSPSASPPRTSITRARSGCRSDSTARRCTITRRTRHSGESARSCSTQTSTKPWP